MFEECARKPRLTETAAAPDMQAATARACAFQLEAPGDDRSAPARLLFGERSRGDLNVAEGNKLFVLDHSEPLGTVQAFATALTTVQWNRG